MNEIPDPHDSGSSGTQQPAPNGIVESKPKSPIEGLPIAKTVEGLAATKSRSMGGEIAASLLAGSFQQISHELGEAKQELKETRTNLEQLQENLSNCRQRSAVLEERVSASKRNRHLKNLSLTAGTALIGIAIEFMRNDMGKFFYIVGALGVLLILFGWLSTAGEDTP